MQITGPSYIVKNIETIAEGSDLRARLYTLAPGGVIPWHCHNVVVDWYFCLGGMLRIETRPPRADERLAGDTRSCPRPRTKISNGNDGEDCRFLLLQGVGVYDFNKV